MSGPRNIIPPLLQFRCPTTPPTTARSWSDRRVKDSEQFLVWPNSTTAGASRMKHMKKGKNMKIMSWAGHYWACGDHGAMYPTCVPGIIRNSSKQLSTRQCPHVCWGHVYHPLFCCLGPIIFISNNYVQRPGYCRVRSNQLFLQYNLSIKCCCWTGQNNFPSPVRNNQ